MGVNLTTECKGFQHRGTCKHSPTIPLATRAGR